VFVCPQERKTFSDEEEVAVATNRRSRRHAQVSPTTPLRRQQPSPPSPQPPLPQPSPPMLSHRGVSAAGRRDRQPRTSRTR